MRSKWFPPICIVIMLGIGAVLYNHLPAQVPTHWGFNGLPDATSDKWIAVLIGPMIGLVIWLLLLAIPYIDPLKASYKLFEPTYHLFINLIVAFIVVLHVVTLGNAIGWNIPVARVVMIAVGLLFALLGNQFGRIQPNWFMGIRTPWTLSDPEVWKRTHRAAGRAFVIAGLVGTLFVIFVPLEIATVIFIVAIGGAAIYSVGYSFIAWRQLHTQNQGS